MHGPRHPSRARGSTRLSICMERGMSGRERARALSEDVWMRVFASWAWGISWNGTTRGARAFETRTR